MRRLTDILKGLAALATTAGIVAGIPYLLVTTVGWPLPTEIPTWEVIERTVTTTGIDDSVIIKTLAIVVWITWTQLAWAIGIETVAAIRGRVARRTATLPGIQLAAARLVATIALIASSFGTVHPAAATPLPSIHAPATAGHATPLRPAPTAHPVAAEAATPTGVAEGPIYRVTSVRESYWSIAHHTVGDPHRWTEIRDLNIGRTMPDGTTLTPHHEALQPGWQLALPNDAVLPAAAYQTAEVTVERGDNQWVLAEERLEDVLDRAATDDEVAPYWRDVVDANRHTIRSGNPDLIYPGEVLHLPPVADAIDHDLPATTAVDTPPPPTPRDVAETVDGHGTTTAEAAGDTTRERPGYDRNIVGDLPSVWVNETDRVDDDWLAAQPDGEVIVTTDEAIPGDIHMWVTEETPPLDAPDDGTEHRDLGISAGATAGALAAGGGVVAAGWWWRRRRLRTIDATPAEAPIDEALTRAAPLDAPRGFDGDRGMWAVGAALSGLRGPAPTPAGVVVSAQLTRVVVPGAGDRTPRGWTRSEQLHDVWELPTTALTGRHVTAAVAAVPGLVRIGANTEDEMLWVNLEAAGIVAIDGATPHVIPVLELIATRLVGRPHTRVLWIGDDAPEGCEPVDPDAAINHLTATARPPSTAVATRRGGETQPLLVIVAAAVPAAHQPALLTAVQSLGPDRGVAVVTSWPTYDAAPEFSWAMTGHGVIDIPTMVTPVTVDGLAEPDEDTVAIEPRPAPTVELQVLGQPRLLVDGDQVPLRRRPSIQLLAYLVTHPKGASTDKLLDVLWPDADNQRAKKPTLQQCATELRRAIGIDLLPRARDGWYRTGVTTDEHRFTQHVTDADTAASDPERAAHLHHALDLIRGAPFEAVDWPWVVTDGFVTAAMQRIHDVAHQLTQLNIDLGRYAAADTTAAQGIVTDPHCDRCWDLRLHAAAAAGNTTHHRHLQDQRHRIARAG